MIQVYFSHTFVPEKSYICKVLFSDILHIPYTIHSSHEYTNYTCVCENGTSIIINDDFFSHFHEPHGYLKHTALPQTYSTLQYNNLTVPFWYGSQDMNIQNNTVYIHADIFACAFFMLSRWEECVVSDRDQYGRFDESKAFTLIHNIHTIPIVHVYAELITKIFADFDYVIPSHHCFTKTISHDVDFMYKWNTPRDVIKSCLGDIIKRRSLHLCIQTLQAARKGFDPYDTYSYIMDLSEQYGYTSTFYILCSKKNKRRLNSSQGRKLCAEISLRTHNIGIHFNNYLQQDIDSMRSDIQFLQNACTPVSLISRQHYLQFSYPETFRALESCGIKQDSTLYYRHNPGFRTGMCVEHTVFDVLQRCELAIKELPLICMDVSVFDYPSIAQAQQKIRDLLSITKQYRGNFVCLWHNSSFCSPEWEHAQEIYQDILRYK
ncbi:MAG: hypothetical protein R6U95_10800 [Bacteroidales bacterium]